MRRKGLILIVSLLCLLLLAGCGKEETPTDEVQNNQPAENTDTDVFTAYEISVKNPQLAVYEGPGYNFDITGYIFDKGDYVIIAQEFEDIGGGTVTVWGKLQTQDGWINLDDAREGEAEITEEDTSEEKPEENPEEETEDEFEPYTLKVLNAHLEIYAGPGYGYKGVGEITDKGTYTIVEEATEKFSSGLSVKWGKLKSGAGWVCIDDAALKTDNMPPHRCTECGRADVSVSRHGLCDACHKKLDVYGHCEVCGTALTEADAHTQDGTRCRDHCACDYCGVDMTTGSYYYIDENRTKILYVCISCCETVFRCSYCGESTYPDETVNGLCSDCNNIRCTECGIPLTDENTAFEGFGKCIDCYYATLDPEYICDNCGADCSFRGVYDGYCEDCYNAILSGKNFCWWCGTPCDGELCPDCDEIFCDWCGDPIMDGHSCEGTNP